MFLVELSNYLLIPVLSTIRSLRLFANKPKNAWISFAQAEVRNSSKCAAASKTDKLDEAGAAVDALMKAPFTW